MKKITKIILRSWLTITSIGAFLFTWTVFAHAPKPAPLVKHTPAVAQQNMVPLPTLAPLEPMQGFSVTNLTPQINPSTTIIIPRLQTGGS